MSRRSAFRLFSVGLGATAAPSFAFAQALERTITCPRGEVLRDGKCVAETPKPPPTPKPPTTCPAGEVLRDGKCERTPTPKPPTTCPQGEVLRDGKCERIQAPTCPQGEVLRDGKCEKPPTPKPPTTCPAGEVLRDGKCVRIEAPPTCRPGEVLRDGRCETPGTCKPGQVMRDGKCVPAEAPGTCREGEVLRGGKCVPAETTPTCPQGEVLRDGKCVRIEQSPCPEGQILENGRCVCPPGQVMQLGRCVAQPSGQTPSNSTCVTSVDSNGATTRLVTTTAFQGQPLTYEYSVAQMTNQFVVGTTIKHGTDILMDSSVRYSPKATPAYQGNVRVSPIFKGPTLGEFFSNDGKVIIATAHGRRLAPFAVGSPSSALRYANGEALVTGPIPPDLAAALQDLLTRAGTATSACSAPPPRHPLEKKRGPGHISDSQHSAGCVACIGLCYVAGIACGAVTLGFGSGACAVAAAGCMWLCNSSGPCCAVHCGPGSGLVDYCCDDGETCLGPQGPCCSPGLVTCGGTDCCDPTDTCISANGTCCPAGNVVCGTSCCDPGSTCAGNTCCPAGQVVCNGSTVCCPPNNVCDASGTACCLQSQLCPPAPGGICCGGSLHEYSTCHDNVCCSGFTEWCGGQCCADICSSDGQCCPTGRYCGPFDGSGICCPPNQFCADAATHTCSGGSKTCQNGQVPCMSENPTTFGPGLCCAKGASCCNGACCPDVNQICCTPTHGLGQTNGKFGCNLEQYCI